MEFLKSISMIINLNKKELINETIIFKINFVFSKAVGALNEQTIRQCEIIENKSDIIYNELTNFMADKPFIWKLIYKYYSIKIKFFEIKKDKFENFDFIKKIENYDDELSLLIDKAAEFVLNYNQVLLKSNYKIDKYDN